MDNNKKEQRALRFAKKKQKFLSHPIACGIWLMIWGFLVQSYIGGAGIRAILDAILKGAGKTPTGNESDILSAVCIVIMSLLMLLIHKLYFRPEYKGSFRKEGLKEKGVIIAIVLFFLLDAVITVIEMKRMGFSAPSLYTLTLALMAGIGEETLYRVLPVSAMMYKGKEKETYMPALIVSSVVFGLIHLGNIVSGAAVPVTILQVISAAITGLFLCALYLRSGNIFWPMLVHFVHDMMSFSIATQSTGLLTMELTAADYYEAGIISVAEIILTIWLLKGKKEQIIAVWKDRWSDTF